MTDQQQPKLEITTSRLFQSWLGEIQSSIALTTYQAGKLFWLGTQENGRLSVFERTLERVMGLAVNEDDLYVSTLYQLWRFRNVLGRGEQYNGFDRVFMPRESRVTGDIDIHDIAADKDGRLLFVSTLFNCIATTDRDHNFKPVWKPSWISQVVPEDRCHLNGMALRDGELRYITSVSRSDVSDAWRDKRESSGVVVDVISNEVVCEGLSMPHSPRWHNGQLYVLNSGTGFFGRVDLQRGQFEPIAFVPGYARGHSKSAKPTPAAACKSSTWSRAPLRIGCAWKAWSESYTTSRSSLDRKGQWGWGSRPTKCAGWCRILGSESVPKNEHPCSFLP